MATDASIKVMISRAAVRGWKLSLADVGSAYLEIDQPRDNVFIEMPRDVPAAMLEEAGFTPGVRYFQVTKCLYGLRESGLEFYKELRRVLELGGWIASEIDPCVFVKENTQGEKEYVATFVDDLLILARDESKKELMELLRNRFEEVKYEEEAKSYLGYNLEYRNTEQGLEIKVNQYGFAKNYCEEHGISAGKPGCVPMKPEMLEKADKDTSRADQKEFASVIGALMHLCKSRLDIMTATAYLSQHQKEPSETHLSMARGIWEYVAGTLELGLTFRNTNREEMIGYCDASWHSHESAHGHTGFYLAFGQNGKPFYAASKKQTMIALSSAEAEIMAMFACVRYVMFIRQLMEDMGHTFTGPTIVYEDNKSAIFMTGQYHATQHSRHMDRRYKWINEMVRLGNIKFEFTPTTEQKADGLTKPMVGKQFLTARNYLLGTDVTLSGVRGGVTDGTEYEWPPVGHPPDREGTQQGQDFQEGKFSSLSDLSRVIPL